MAAGSSTRAAGAPSGRPPGARRRRASPRRTPRGRRGSCRRAGGRRRRARGCRCTPAPRADRYAQALREVEHLPGDSPPERRTREIGHLHLTRWLPALLDRKDRLSMAAGLEVRAPFCDHRLVEYVHNTPWDLKTPGGDPKGLLKRATRDIVPRSVLERRKSPYPTTADQLYEKDLRARTQTLLADRSSPAFDVVDASPGCSNTRRAISTRSCAATDWRPLSISTGGCGSTASRRNDLLHSTVVDISPELPPEGRGAPGFVVDQVPTRVSVVGLTASRTGSRRPKRTAGGDMQVGAAS
ncbi:asparagine synthase C-terminal domain-containing protein [Streptomyces massasporeus]|uniref:asparagine synthase C-terminal domain-containing protein n=1 Tax=Streptomyces massasporeus TaxID=67324 RepID=UPI0033FBD2AE